MPTIRVGTFNCENLFARPAIFMEPPAKAKALLADVAKLQSELGKPVFDQPKVKALKKRLAGYVYINDIRGKHAKAGIGANDWVGWIEFKREDITREAIDNTARVLTDLEAEVIALVEVENRPALKKFHDDILYKKFLKPAGKTGYEHVLLIDGNDDRGIDVALLSRLPVQDLRTHVHETTTYMNRRVATFSRDCLEVDVVLPGGRVLTVMCNHLKSMGYSPPGDRLSNIRRLGQAQRLEQLVQARQPVANYVIVAGDLNSDPSSTSLAPLVNSADLYNVNLELPEAQRGTYHTGNKQLDYLFVSAALKPKLKNVHIERRGTYTKTRWPNYPTVTSDKTSASDHCAVVAEFDV